jgi:hypothetical protein
MTEIKQVQILKQVQPPTGKFLFPRWANYLVPVGVIVAIGVLTYIPVLLALGLSPKTLDVGYQPVQPIPFSHKVHAGDLKMDCRYCHSTVDKTAFAAIPPTQTCMNCHAAIRSESELLTKMRTSYTVGTPISWIKVHDLPDFVYFNHSAHVNKGVACVTCHGRIDQMEEVHQSQPISMGWCLNCHREPEQHLRPREQVTSMDWDAMASLGKSQEELGEELKSMYQIQSKQTMTSCTICHR